MRYLIVLAVLVTACGVGPAGPAGPRGPAGPPGPGAAASADGGALSCTPGATLCDGSKIWQCTKSGQDADLVVDCANISLASQGGDNTATNPYSCFADHFCPTTAYYSSPGPACCRHVKPLCSATFTSNAALSFAIYDEPSGPSGLSPFCGFGSQGTTPPTPIFEVFITGSVNVSLPFPTATIQPGQTVDIATLLAAGSSQVQLTSGGVTCSTWSGMVTYTTAIPSFGVSLNLKCTEAGKTSMTLAGTFTGAS